MMGNFVNSMPLRIRFSEGQTVDDVIKQVFETTTEALNHQSCPYENIVKELHCDRQNNRNPLFDVMFSLQNFVSPIIETENMKLVQMPIQVGTAKNDIRLFAALTDNGISLEMEYDTDLFDAPFMDNFRQRYLNVLQLIISDVDMKVSELSDELMRQQKEADRLFLENYNNTDRPGYADHLVHDMIQEQVEKTPDAIALICDGEQLTYRELDNRATALASVLRQKGVKPRDKVGIVLHRSPELLIGLYAIMKAGAVYVPADPIYPIDRIDYIFGNSEIVCVISQSDIDLPSGYTRYNIHDLEKEQPTENCDFRADITPDDLIYILYTSGSTGKPKGVMIRHSSVSNYILSVAELIPHENPFAILATTTICFDISAIETWRTLVLGGTIVFATDNERMDMNAQKKLIVRYQIKEMNITPSQMSVLLLDNNDDVWRSVGTIMIGGEAVPPSLLQKMQEHIPSARIFDLYGPTETTIYSSVMELTHEKEVTIGKPIANTKLYVVDKDHQLLPIGETGELCIGGAGLSTGYMNRPDLTERQFVMLPESNEFVYKTGDLATLRVDGKMLCHGRIDNQIKIRGYRVELEEIEQTIMKSGLCRECTVFLMDSEHLGAIYTAVDNYTSDDIIAQISGILPHYMVPSKLVRVDSIPLNVNGKADRKKALELANQVEDTIEVQTSGYTEDVLLAMFRKITLNNRIGINDSFFEAGGSSLGIFQVLAEIESVFGVKLQYADVYKNMTVAGIAAMIENISKESSKDLPAEIDASYIQQVINVAELKCTKEPPLNTNNILLTGANGFLGNHLLYELLLNTNSDIYCLVRSEDRLIEAIRYYWGEGFYQRYLSRIKCIKDDISAPNICIADEIKCTIKAVYHAAADTKHYGEFKDSFAINTLGTRHMINLCAEIGATLHHISTSAVSGIGIVKIDTDMPDRLCFTEDGLYIGQRYEDNVYIHSKFLAERMILLAIENGLNAHIYRVGNLTERKSDGVYQMNNSNNAFMIREKAIATIGAISPALKTFMFEKTPVDLCAKAIYTLSTQDLDNRVFHVFNPTQLNGYDYYRALFPNLIEVSDDEWFALLERLAETDTSCAVMRAYVKNLLEVAVPIETRCDMTLEALKKCNFYWEEKE